MTSLRVFFVGGLISFRALFNWLSPWIYIPSMLVAPIFQILLFAYIGRNAGVESDAQSGMFNNPQLFAFERSEVAGLVIQRGEPPEATYIFKHALV